MSRFKKLASIFNVVKKTGILESKENGTASEVVAGTVKVKIVSKIIKAVLVIIALLISTYLFNNDKIDEKEFEQSKKEAFEMM